MIKSYLKVEKFLELLKTYNLSQKKFAEISKVGRMSEIGRPHLSMIISGKSVGVKIKAKILTAIRKIVGNPEIYNDWFE